MELLVVQSDLPGFKEPQERFCGQLRTETTKRGSSWHRLCLDNSIIQTYPNSLQVKSRDASWREEQHFAKDVTADSSLAAKLESHLNKIYTRQADTDGCTDLCVTAGALNNSSDEGKLNKSLHPVHHAGHGGIGLSAYNLPHLLHWCIDFDDLAAGRELSWLSDQTGFRFDPYLASHLICLFASSQRLSEANQVFSKLYEPDIFSWNAIIVAHTKLGENDEAIRLYNQMRNSNVKPDGYIFVAVVKACLSIATLYQVHAHIIEAAFESDAFVCSSLIDTYIECRSFDDACRVFNNSYRTNVVMWNALITGYALHGNGEDALTLFEQMQEFGMQPNRITYVSMLKACSNIPALEQGRWVHASILEIDFESGDHVGNTLIDMYAKCGSLEDAQAVFDRSPKRDIVTWNVLLSGYAHHGDAKQALQVFEKMHVDNLQPDRVTFISVLTACSSIATLECGRQIHALIINGGWVTDLFVGNTLIDMYARCGSLIDAATTFCRLPKRNVVTWSALLAGHVQHGHSQVVFQLVEKMQKEGVKPNQIIFSCILKACSGTALLEHGRDIHAQVIECGFESELFLGNSLIDMYANCRSLSDARMVFDRLPEQDVVTWTALITGYTRHGHVWEAFALFEQMQGAHMDGNLITFISLLKACSSIADLEHGKRIHAHMIKRGCQLDVSTGTALIDMYGKCGSLEDALMIFDKLPSRDVMTWSSLILGYAQHGHGLEALQFFKQMRQQSVEPNQVTFICILKACSSIAAVEQGRQAHSQIIEYGFELDAFVGNALIDMYVKCGSLEDAHTMFHSMPTCDVVTWSSLMKGYAQQCNYEWAFRCFEDMQGTGLKPDDVTFVCLLSACSHASLLDEGCLFFKSMMEKHGIAPTLEHYNALVDLLGHVGRLTEAEDLLETLAFSSNIVGWTSLLSSCRTCANVVLGRRCFNVVVKIEPGNAAGYVLMSNIYAYAGLQGDADKLEEVRKQACAWKKPAKAFIEIDDQVHSFMVGDKAHPRSDEIYAKLEVLNTKIEKSGYEPRLDLVPGSVPDKNKKDVLCGHSEKLAIAFGLVCTPPGTTIRVSKNLRMCADCHNATKIISKVEVREIIVVDTYCIHQFQEGNCSCKDNL